MNRSRLKSLLLAALIGLGTFCLLLAADRVLGLFSPELKLAARMFPPRANHTVSTPEFTYTASINRLGFRDQEFSLQKTGNFRVLVLGDSTTYGWGVNIEHSWTKVLERSLRAKGLRVEIANLGMPGCGPIEYANIAQVAIPLLRPDLVVVAVLQTDDLQQSVANQDYSFGADERLKRLLGASWRGLFSNIYARIRPTRIPSPAFRQTAALVRSGFDQDEETRFRQIDPQVQNRFMNGELNPVLVYLAIKRSNYYAQAGEQNSPFVRSHIEALSEQFERVRQVASRQGASLVVVSMPHRVYVSQAGLEMTRRIGFIVHDEMLGSDLPDAAIRAASQKKGLPFIEVTNHFRQACQPQGCYFRFDDHFTIVGHDVYAKLLEPWVEGLIAERLSPNRREPASR